MNRNSMSALERRIDKLASLFIQPRLMPLSERDRTVQLSVVLILFEDRPPINDKRAMEECISNSLNAVRRHQSAIDEFKQEDFENRLCRLRRALSEMTRSGNLNPLVDPLNQESITFFSPLLNGFCGALSMAVHGVQLRLEERNTGQYFRHRTGLKMIWLRGK